MTRDEFLDQAVRTSLGTTTTDGTWPYLGEFAPGTMLDPGWDAIEMLQYELMAFGMRNKYGFTDKSN
jgi:hypothetical protein